MNTDVLIVGAGPAGLTLASELARFGLRVRIIDKSPNRTDKSKAIVVWSRTLELFHRSGLDTQLLSAGITSPAASIYAGSKSIARITFDQVDTPYPFALMIPQSETERVLETHLQSIGVTVERNVELLQFQSGPNSVTATLQRKDGSKETFTTPWLIGCDGAHSTVRHQLNFQFHGSALNSEWILADVALDNAPNAQDINILWHAEGILAIFPFAGNRFRIVADAGAVETSSPRPDPTLAEVQGVLDQRGPGRIIATDPHWLATFRINERKVTDYRAGRVFLAGDAAHIHSPAGGQGMNTGMQDAFNLAWKLALVHKNICRDQPLLDSYTTERSAIAEGVLKAAGRLTTVAIMKGGIKQTIRNHIASLVLGLTPVRHAIADAISEVSIGYPESPLTSHAGTSKHQLRPGERAPVRANDSPIGAGNSPRFALFANPSDQSAALIKRFSNLLEPAVRPQFHEDAIHLARPDAYIALATNHNDWQSVRKYLSSLAI